MSLFGKKDESLFRRVPSVEYLECGPFRIRVYPEDNRYEMSVTVSFEDSRGRADSKEAAAKSGVEAAIKLCEGWLNQLKAIREKL